MDWLAYFQRNRIKRMHIAWEKGIIISDTLRAPLIRSLQRFQVGESGDGKHLKAAASDRDNVYQETLALFIAEESEHARLLAKILQELDAPLLESHWSDTAFILIRHLAGLRLELMILLMAEMIAKRYYRILHDASNNPILRTVCAQILHDEVGHVAFHCDFLRESMSLLPMPIRLAICGAWWLVYRIVCLVVMLDHRDVIRASGVTSGEFWEGCGKVFDQTAARIFFSRPAARRQPAQLSLTAQ
jgi:hypothetical protein